MILAHTPYVTIASLATAVGESLIAARRADVDATIDRLVRGSGLEPSESFSLREGLHGLKDRMRRVAHVIRPLKQREADAVIEANAEIMAEELGMPIDSAVASLDIIRRAAVLS